MDQSINIDIAPIILSADVLGIMTNRGCPLENMGKSKRSCFFFFFSKIHQYKFV